MKIEKLGPHFSARIHGVDLSQSLSDGLVVKIKTVFLEHLPHQIEYAEIHG